MVKCKSCGKETIWEIRLSEKSGWTEFEGWCSECYEFLLTMEKRNPSQFQGDDKDKAW